MKPKLFLYALVLFSAFNANAQIKAKITGQARDNNGSPVKAITILLNKAADSILVKTAVTDAKGNFEMEGIKAGNYFISTSMVGMQKKFSAVFTAKDGETVIVPILTVLPAGKDLQGVTVTGTYAKPMIEVKADKTVLNVENSINATGSNAFELLQKAPGVVTDKDDNILLKGKNGVRVYIDGRPTQMGNADLAAYLKSINSVDIESIEMIDNPSAKYDASGNAGIINIKLKKNKKFGTNGTFSSGLNVGERPKTNAALSLNYRNKKANLFSNYSNGWNDNINHFNLFRNQLDSSYDQKSLMTSNGWNHNIKLGADFFVSKLETIGFIATLNLNDNNNKTESRTPISSISTGKIGSILYASNAIPAKSSNMNLNFNYRFADSIGHEFNMDFDIGSYDKKSHSLQPNAYFAPYPETLLYNKDYRNNTPTNIKIYTGKIDYETPFKKGKLGAGVKISSVKSANTFDFFNIISGYDFIDYNRSNTFSYTENINAGYVNYNRPLNKKWSIQTGLRVENVVSDGELKRADGLPQADDRIKRNYTDLFPSAAITLNQSMNHIFNLTYSRRIDRPNYQELNPFENKIDELTYQKGNAFLKPQYTNSIALTHTYKYRYTTSLSYSHISDYKAQVIDTAEKSRSFITQKNLATQDIYNINFSLPFQIKKWWSLYANINAYNSHYKADFGVGKKIDINVQSANMYMANSFTIGGGYTGEISGFVTSPSVWAGTFKSKALGTLDLGLQKTLFAGKATFKVSYTDLLKTLHWAGISDFGAAYIKVSGNWESQQLRMNFTLRFGNKQVKASRQRTTASEEENKRTQSGGGIGGGN
jgi:hypothetical protein